MDIVNRIKTYMNANAIGSTQFADACRIPRPTLSQILSGRNKKISDEVISKIHEAYPELSVLWLLFGEGDMIAKGNNAFSGGQKADELSTSGVNSGGYQAPGDTSSASTGDQEPTLFGVETLIFEDDRPMKEAPAVVVSDVTSAGKPVVEIPADGSKSIVNIMIFYSDNSYQSFVPR